MTFFSMRNIFFNDYVHIPRFHLQHSIIHISFVKIVRRNGLNDKKWYNTDNYLPLDVAYSSQFRQISKNYGS